MPDDPEKLRWPAPNELAECAIYINRVIATSGAESPQPSPIKPQEAQAKGRKCGTKLYSLPSKDSMREARRRKRAKGPGKVGVGFFIITDGVVDPNIGACRAAIENSVAARRLTPRGRGRQFDVDEYLAALHALEKARAPLRINSAAMSVIAASLNMKDHGARSLLRRLIDLRKRLAPEEE